MQMRAIADWYFTAHPPIMHDLHESLALLYTYSGGAPQNPNLDPLLFAELPFFSNWELAQMTKWGMPGVYTHAFMDGWSPGYLGSIAYNHNGMMRMYETQSGRDGGPGPGAGGPPAAAGEGRGAGAGGGRAGGGRGGGGRGGEAAAAGRGAGAAGEAGAPPAEGRGAGAARAGAQAGRAGGGPPPAGPGVPAEPGPCRPDAAAVRIASGIAGFRSRRTRPRTSRAATTRTTCRPACSRPAAHGDVPEPRARELLHENPQLDRAGHARSAPFGYVIPAQRDMTRPAELVRILRVQGIEVGQTTAAVQDRRRVVRRRART